MENAPKYLGYTRVSKENPNGKNISIDTQTQTLTKEAEHRGFDLEPVNEGEGVSGKKLSNRPVLKETLARLDRGEAEGLIVTKLDRLARSTIDFLTIMERAEKKGWKLIVLDFNIDTSTPAGRMIATVMAGFAQFERERISERTREGLALKKARGAKLGKPSTVPNEVIAKVLEMKSKRLTLKEISQTLNEQGIPTTVEGARWHPTSIQRIIQRAS